MKTALKVNGNLNQVSARVMFTASNPFYYTHSIAVAVVVVSTEVKSHLRNLPQNMQLLFLIN